MFFSFSTSLAQSHGSFHFKVLSKDFLWYILMYGSACTQAFQGGKEKYMFFKLHTSQMRLLLRSFTFAWTSVRQGQISKKGIIPIFTSFFCLILQPDIWFWVGQHCWVGFIYFDTKMSVCFSGKLHSSCHVIRREYKQMNQIKRFWEQELRWK